MGFHQRILEHIGGSTAIVGCLCGASSNAELSCGYEVTVIQGPWCGDPWGYPPTDGRGLGEGGEVVGYYDQCVVGPAQPFVWTVQAGLVTLALPEGFSEGWVEDIDSSTGWIAGSVAPQGAVLGTAALWADGEAIDLGTLPGGNFSQGRATAGGSVVGLWGNTTTGPNPRAFIWRDGEMIDLDLGTPGSCAEDVNHLGDVVGWAGTSFMFDGQAFLWSSGNVTQLGQLPNGFFSIATSLNGNSQIAGWALLEADGFPVGRTRGFLWDNGVMTGLPPLPGHDLSGASSINDSGLVVGQSWSPGSSGVIWCEGIVHDLNELLQGGAAVHINFANTIANDGSIVGTGNDGDGDVVAVLLTPIPAVVGDLTCDGHVFSDDFVLLLANWGPCEIESLCAADLSEDGVVNIVDLLILLANWG